MWNPFKKSLNKKSSTLSPPKATLDINLSASHSPATIKEEKSLFSSKLPTVDAKQIPLRIIEVNELEISCDGTLAVGPLSDVSPKISDPLALGHPKVYLHLVKDLVPLEIEPKDFNSSYENHNFGNIKLANVPAGSDFTNPAVKNMVPSYSVVCPYCSIKFFCFNQPSNLH
ncbi:hypothetical protein ABSA28_00358 [Candidatus Hepatincolaceae symbiont of Richtersius coronifer]